MHVSHTSTSTVADASDRRWTWRRSLLESAPHVRAIAVLVGVITLLTTADSHVPLASGVAIAALVPAVLVDLLERRLPNRLVATAGLVGTGVLVIEMLGTHSLIDPADAVVGAFTMAGPLLIAHLVAPASMGLGDVKAALVLGAALGLVNPILGLVALAIGSAATAIVGLAVRRRELAFGPGLVAGAVVVLLAVVSPADPFGKEGPKPLDVTTATPGATSTGAR